MSGPLVSAEWLRALVAASDPGLVLVDVRADLGDPAWGRARYREGHLPGAVFADLERDLSAPKTGTNGRHPLPSAPRMAEVFSRFGIGPDSFVTAYDDRSGMFAARLWWMLRYLGHSGAAVLDGGLPAWLEVGGALRSGEETRPARTFVPRKAPEMALAAPAVEAGLEGRKQLLLDAREPARWRGEVEPIDPVAGRIPGAKNHPWTGNIGEDGRFRAPEELRARFRALGLEPAAAADGENRADERNHERDGRRIVCYCGSGLTAALNALALERAGIEGAAVYSGSWSEWCADPKRPVETGPEGAGPG